MDLYRSSNLKRRIQKKPSRGKKASTVNGHAELKSNAAQRLAEPYIWHTTSADVHRNIEDNVREQPVWVKINENTLECSETYIDSDAPHAFVVNETVFDKEFDRCLPNLPIMQRSDTLRSDDHYDTINDDVFDDDFDQTESLELPQQYELYPGERFDSIDDDLDQDSNPQANHLQSPETYLFPKQLLPEVTHDLQQTETQIPQEASSSSRDIYEDTDIEEIRDIPTPLVVHQNLQQTNDFDQTESLELPQQYELYPGERFDSIDDDLDQDSNPQANHLQSPETYLFPKQLLPEVTHDLQQTETQIPQEASSSSRDIYEDTDIEEIRDIPTPLVVHQNLQQTAKHIPHGAASCSQELIPHTSSHPKGYEKMIEIFQPLIVKKLIVHEILPHLSFIEQQEELLAVERRSPQEAVICLLNKLKSCKEVRKWNRFLEALQSCGYDSIVQNIKGYHFIEHTFQQNHIKNLTGKLNQTIRARELLPRLYAEGLISQTDREEIEQKFTNYGNIGASTMLLNRIHRKLSNWYTTFIAVLRAEGFPEIAKDLDIPYLTNSRKIKMEQLHASSQVLNVEGTFDEDDILSLTPSDMISTLPAVSSTQCSLHDRPPIPTPRKRQPSPDTSIGRATIPISAEMEDESFEESKDETAVSSTQCSLHDRPPIPTPIKRQPSPDTSIGRATIPISAEMEDELFEESKDEIFSNWNTSPPTPPPRLPIRRQQQPSSDTPMRPPTKRRPVPTPRMICIPLSTPVDIQSPNQVSSTERPKLQTQPKPADISSELSTDLQATQFDLLSIFSTPDMQPTSSILTPETYSLKPSNMSITGSLNATLDVDNHDREIPLSRHRVAASYNQVELGFTRKEDACIDKSVMPEVPVLLKIDSDSLMPKCYTKDPPVSPLDTEVPVSCNDDCNMTQYTLYNYSTEKEMLFETCRTSIDAQRNDTSESDFNQYQNYDVIAPADLSGSKNKNYMRKQRKSEINNIQDEQDDLYNELKHLKNVYDLKEKSNCMLRQKRELMDSIAIKDKESEALKAPQISGEYSYECLNSARSLLNNPRSLYSVVPSTTFHVENEENSMLNSDKVNTNDTKSFKDNSKCSYTDSGFYSV